MRRSRASRRRSRFRKRRYGTRLAADLSTRSDTALVERAYRRALYAAAAHRHRHAWCRWASNTASACRCRTQYGDRGRIRACAERAALRSDDARHACERVAARQRHAREHGRTALADRRRHAFAALLARRSAATCATPTTPCSSSSIPISARPCASIRCICSKRAGQFHALRRRSTTRQATPEPLARRSRSQPGEVRLFRAAAEPFVLLAQPHDKRGAQARRQEDRARSDRRAARRDRKRDAFGRSRTLPREAHRRRGGGNQRRDFRAKGTTRSPPPCIWRAADETAWHEAPMSPGAARRPRSVEGAHSARSRRAAMNSR